jgi:general secretion pathway protein A
MDLNHIGLAESPFGLKSDSRFVFESAVFNEALGELLAAIERRDTLIVLTGENGSGKTTLCRTLLERLDASTFVSVIASPFLSLGDVLAQVLTDFDTDSIADFLHRLPERARALVVVDEAQDIDLRVLERLGTFRGLQVLIIGRPELMTRLSQSELRRPLDGRRVQWLKVAAIDRREVGGYIDWRMTAATRSGEAAIAFTRDAVETVGTVSDGVPRTINRLCAAALELASNRRARAIDSSIVREAARRIELRRAQRSSRRGLQRAAIVAVTVAVVVGELVIWRRHTAESSTAATERAARTVAAATPAEAASTAAKPPQDGDRTTASLPVIDAVLVSVTTTDDLRRAQAVVQDLTDRGLPAFSQPAAGGAKQQVLVGPYVSSDEAVAVQRQLEPLKYSATTVVTSAR